MLGGDRTNINCEFLNPDLWELRDKWAHPQVESRNDKGRLKFYSQKASAILNMPQGEVSEFVSLSFWFHINMGQILL